MSRLCCTMRCAVRDLAHHSSRVSSQAVHSRSRSVLPRCHSTRAAASVAFESSPLPSSTPPVSSSLSSSASSFSSIGDRESSLPLAQHTSSRSSGRKESSYRRAAAVLAGWIALNSAWDLWSQGETQTLSHVAAAPAQIDSIASAVAKPAYHALPASATEAERNAVAQLRRSLLESSSQLEPALQVYLQQWALDDDWCLLRYVRAHKLHVLNAQGGVLATARWRLTEGVDAIRSEEFAHIYIKGLMYVSTSTDEVGRSLIVNRKNPNPSVGWSEAVFRTEIRSLVYTLERSIREMDDRLARGEANSQEMDAKWIWLIDMSDYSATSATPWHVTKSLVDTMRLHYPERLHCGVIVDAPWALRSLCKLLRPVIPKVTRDKVLFLSSRDPKTQDTIRHLIGSAARLPVESGIAGAATKFDYESYMANDPVGRPRPDQIASAELAAAKLARIALEKLTFWK